MREPSTDETTQSKSGLPLPLNDPAQQPGPPDEPSTCENRDGGPGRLQRLVRRASRPPAAYRPSGRLMCRMAEMGTNVRPLGSSSITPASPTCTSLPSSVAPGDAGKPPPRRSATDTTLPAHSPISDPMFVLFEVRLIPPATPTCVFVRVGASFRHRLPLAAERSAKLPGPPSRTLKLEKTRMAAPVSFSRWLAGPSPGA